MSGNFTSVEDPDIEKLNLAEQGMLKEESIMRNINVPIDSSEEPAVPSQVPLFQKPVLMESLSFHKLTNFQNSPINKSDNKKNSFTASKNMKVARTNVMKFHEIYSSGSDAKVTESFSYDSPLRKSSSGIEDLNFHRSVPISMSTTESIFDSEVRKSAVEQDKTSTKPVEDEIISDKIDHVWRRHSVLESHLPDVKNSSWNQNTEDEETVKEGVQPPQDFHDEEGNDETKENSATHHVDTTNDIMDSSSNTGSNKESDKASLMRKMSSFGGDINADIIVGQDLFSSETDNSGLSAAETNNRSTSSLQIQQIPGKLLKRVNSKATILGSSQHLTQLGLHGLSYKNIYFRDDGDNNNGNNNK